MSFSCSDRFKIQSIAIELLCTVICLFVCQILIHRSTQNIKAQFDPSMSLHMSQDLEQNTQWRNPCPLCVVWCCAKCWQVWNSKKVFSSSVNTLAFIILMTQSIFVKKIWIWIKYWYKLLIKEIRQLKKYKIQAIPHQCLWMSNWQNRAPMHRTRMRNMLYFSHF